MGAKKTNDDGKADGTPDDGTERPPTERPAMTVQEAGRRGGAATKARYGPEFYEEIGRKGGSKVKSLLAEGRRLAEAEEGGAAGGGRGEGKSGAD